MVRSNRHGDSKVNYIRFSFTAGFRPDLSFNSCARVGVPAINVLFSVPMGELIELPYRRFSRHVVDRLVRTGYLQAFKRHQSEAVTDAWNRFRQDVVRMIGDRHGPKQEG
jgi:hypothetical protein